MSYPEYIPGPNNELILQKPRPTGSYPVAVDFATSASYAETASFTLGYILSASYSNFAATASYLLGSIANAVSSSWANFSGHAISADTASWAISSSHALTASYFSGYVETASQAVSASYATTSSFSWYAVSSSYATIAPTSISASYALTASYALNGGGTSPSASYLSGSSATVQRLTLSNTDIRSYMVTQLATGVTFATPVDQFPDVDGNSAKWLISINDGSSYKTSEIISIWDPVSNVTNFAEVTTNIIGTIPVAMSVNISGDNVRLIANPASGSWTIKSVRLVL